MKRNFGWIRDKIDHRDLKFSPAPIMEMPEEVNLVYLNPDVYDQKTWGSCVFNAEGSMFQERLKKQGQNFIPSRFFPYYNVREQYGKISDDCGASMRDGIKMYVKYGIIPETEWTYEKKNFSLKPPKEIYEHALKHQAVFYQSIDQNLQAMKSCLAMGNTFVGGIEIFDSFMSTEVRRTGIVPIPKGYETYIGGHAIGIVGYFDRLKSFLCKNSWGKGWGMHGYFLIPYDYILNKDLACDFWTITFVETDL